MRRRILPECLLALLAFALACGGDIVNSISQGTGDPKDWAIALSAARPALIVPQGGTDTVTLLVTRSGGFTGQVDITAPSLPAGYTSSVSNLTTANNVTTALATVTAGANVSPGTLAAIFVAASPTNSVPEASVSVNVTVPPKPSVIVSAPVSMSVARGGSTPATITLTRTGFTEDVALSLAGAPTGLIATFTPNPVAGSATQSSMVLVADATAVEGTYNVTIRANTGIPSQATAPIAVTIIGFASLSLAVTPPSVSIARGGSGQVTVNVTRTNYSQPVALTVTGLPGGSTATPPAPITGASGVVAISTNAGTVPGTYQITVQTTGTGTPPANTAFSLVVTP